MSICGHLSYKVCDGCLQEHPTDPSRLKILQSTLLSMSNPSDTPYCQAAGSGDCGDCSAVADLYTYSHAQRAHVFVVHSGASGHIEMKWDGQQVWFDGSFYGEKDRYRPAGDLQKSLREWHAQWIGGG